MGKYFSDSCLLRLQPRKRNIREPISVSFKLDNAELQSKTEEHFPQLGDNPSRQLNFNSANCNTEISAYKSKKLNTTESLI